MWHDNFLGSVKPNTEAKYKSIIRTHIVPAFGKVKLSALTPPMIQQYYKKLLNRDPPYSPKSISLINGCLHKCFDKALKLGYIRVNPCDACELPRIKKPPLGALHDEKVGEFIEAIKGNPLEDLFLFALFTGCRISECIGLQWSCVNLVTGAVIINKQLLRNPKDTKDFYYETLKNDKERIVTLPSSMIRMMVAHKKKQSEQRMKAGELWNNPDNLVFVNEIGGHLYPNGIERNIKQVYSRIGEPELTFHSLRHSYATLALQNGDDLKTVSETLGHSSVSITADVYASVSQKMRQDSADRMERFIQGL